MIKWLVTIASISLLCSCTEQEKQREEPLPPEEEKQILVEEVVEIDTNGVWQKIKEFHTDQIGVYDSASRDSVYYEFPFIADYKIELTGDEYLDYLIVEDHMGGPTYGTFHDGATGEVMEYTDYLHVWSRPGVDIEVVPINVYCEDGHQEVLIRSGSGGTLGSYYNMEIYRYDDSLKGMKSIFYEAISVDHWETSSDSTNDYAHHIDVNYLTQECVNQIMVREAIPSEEHSYTLNVKIKKGGSTQKYVFNPAKNVFELQ